MATVSKSQPTKRKEGANKIKIQMNGSNAKVIHDSSGNDSDGASSSKATSLKGKEQAKKKEVPTRIDTSVLENVSCTACGRQLNPYKNSSVCKHPELKVIICKKCDKFLSSGKIAKDGDGIDEQCRWCGEGGRLVVCDLCSSAFCKACVMRNFNRSEFNNINDQESWKCYICDKSQAQSLRDNYRNVRDTMKALQAKEKEKDLANSTKDTPTTASGNGRKPSGASQNSNNQGLAVKNGSVASGSSSGGDVALSLQDLDVDHTNVDVIMDKLSTATNTFKEMLRALRSQFHSTSPRRVDEAPPMFHFSLGSSADTNFKKQRCAKVLNRGLITYFQSLRKILHPTNATAPASAVHFSASVTNQTTPVSSEVEVITDSSPNQSLESSNKKPSLKKEKESSSVSKPKLSAILPRPNSSSKPSASNTDKEKSKSISASGKITEKSQSKLLNSDQDKEVSTAKEQCDNVDNVLADSDISAACPTIEPVENSNHEEMEIEQDSVACNVDEENAAAKLDMIQQLAEEMLDSDGDVSDSIHGDEDVEEELSDNDKEEATKTSEHVSQKDLDTTKRSQSNITVLGSKSKPAKNSKSADEAKKASNQSVDGKKINKKSNSAKEGQGETSQEKANKTDDSDVEKVSSSDPLDSDDEDHDSVNRSKRKSKKKKKDHEKVEGSKKKAPEPKKNGQEPKKIASEPKKNEEELKKNEEEPKKNARGRPARNQAGNDTTAKEKTAAVKDKETAKNKQDKDNVKEGEDGEEDEVDKEIEKLSKLPTVHKKKKQTKKDGEDEKDKEEEEGKDKGKESTKTDTQKSKKGVKSTMKDDLNLDDLSSDGEDNGNKADSEDYDEEDDDLLPKVTFALGANEDDKEDLAAKNKLLQEINEDEEDDDEDEQDDDSDSEDDSDESDKKKSKTPKVKKGKDSEADKENGDDDDDDENDSDDSEKEIGKKKRLRSKLLGSKLSDSDSDVGASKKKKVKDENYSGKSDESSSGSSLDSDDSDEKDDSDEVDSEEDEEEKGSKKKGKKGKRKRKGKKKKKKGSDNEEDPDEEEEPGKGKKGKKRKRIKKMSESSDGEKEKEGDEDDEDGPSYGKRKKIRKMMSNKKLEDSTKAAAKAETKRRKRIAAKQREFNIETINDDNNPMNAPITTKLILEPGKEEGDDPIIQVNKKLVRKLKPHQVEAVQFMWDCLYESVKRTKKEEGAGCILAHCMGLGKTLSVISFVHTILTHEKALNQRTCLVVSPLNTVLNWRNEWSMWLEKKDRLEVWELASCKQNNARAETLREWQESGGIMIIGYEMYRNLTMGARIKNKRLKKAFQETLVNPGPDICVCDEGHVLKNEASSLSKAMNMMKTRRRIVLTGTPLQNNLNEYHCMVSFVKPNLLGTKKEFNNRFISPIQNGQCTDSTQRDVRIMKARAHVLHEMLAGCVQRRDYSALTKFLPPKQEYVISVRLSNVQIDLYNKYLELSGQGVDGVFNNKGARLFKDYQNLMKIWTHPWVLKLAEIRDELKARYDDDEDSFIDDDSNEERSMSSSSSDSDEEKIISDSGDDEAPAKGPNAKKGTKRTRAKARRQAGEESDPEEVIAEWKTKMRSEDPEVKPDVPDRVSKEWWAQFVNEEDKARMELSNKLFLLFEILRMCEEIGDKVLIFSQSILSLNIIESFLETVDSKFQAEMEKKNEENPEAEETEEDFGKCWTKNLDYYRMDGSTSAQNRQMWAESFNDLDNYRARLFLISTKAGGLGINLVAANRVIIFDASWNPSHDVQSIFRVYRFGQIKPCYIYRFLAQGTMEEKIYERQVTKLSLSQRVVDEHQIERHFSANDLRELYNFKPEKWEEEGEHATLDLPKDPLLAEVLKSHRQCVVSFHEHDSLLENQIEQTLTEEEKKAAWEEYENEKKGIIVRGPGMESMGRTASWPMMAAAQILSKEQIAATVHALRQQLPDLPEDVFHMHVQHALRRQVQLKQEEMRRVEMMRMQELTYLNMMQQQQEMGGVMQLGDMGAMQNMAPWMQIQHLRAMQNHLMQGGRGYNSRMGGMSTPISNRPDEAINLDESPSK